MATHYASPAGSATWDGSTNIATPCALATALSNVAAGDTVYLRGGTYNAGLIINNKSGTQAERISFLAYGSEVPVLENTTNYIYSGRYHALYLYHSFYIRVSGVVGNRVAGSFLFQITRGSSHNEVAYSEFNGNGRAIDVNIWKGNEAYGDEYAARHNWIHHTTIHSVGYLYYSGEVQDGGGMQIGAYASPIDQASGNNSIEDCTFYSGGHHNIETYSKFNVLRGNYFHHEGSMPNETGYEPQYGPDSVPPAASDNLWGNRNIQLYDGTGQEGMYCLVEGNRFGHAGPPPDDDGGDGMTVTSPKNIIRFNDIFNSQNNGVLFKTGASSYCDNNVFYNNTIYKSGRWNNTGPQWSGKSFLWYGTYPVYPRVGNDIINNIFNTYGGSADMNTPPAGNRIESNFWTANGDPLFINTSVSDVSSTTLPNLSLGPGSSCIQAGTYMTRANGAGDNSTLLTVDKALFFQDGTWGSDLTHGVTLFPDWIAVGSATNVVEIESINYSTNVITLALPATWADNAPVWLYKNSRGERVLYGNAPDLGAHPSTEAAAGPELLVVSAAAVALAASAPTLYPGADYSLAVGAAAIELTADYSLNLTPVDPMPWDIRLGPAGSESLLPALNWPLGSSPKMPIGRTAHVEKVALDDGSVRYSHRIYAPRKWTLTWARLTAADVQGIANLAAYNEPLHYQNKWVSAEWCWVIITAFERIPITTTLITGGRFYRVTLELEETS